MIGSLDHRTIFVRLVLVNLVPDLCTSLSPAKLPPKLEAWVPVDPDLSPINDLQIETVNGLLRLLSRRILNEAEPARRLLDLVEAHDKVYHLAALAEKLKQLSLVSVEREVAHVEGRRYP